MSLPNSPSPRATEAPASAPVASAPATGMPGPDPSRDRRVRARVAGVAAMGLAVVAALMVWVQQVEPRSEPWNSPALTAAKAQLQAEPRNEELKNRIRVLDLELRQAYFRSLERNRTGAWLLAGAAVALVWLARQAFIPAATRVAGVSAAAGADREALFVRTRATVLATGVVGAVALVALGASTRTHLPEAMAALTDPGSSLAGAPAGSAASASGSGSASGSASGSGSGSASGSGASAAAASGLAVPAGPTAEEWAANWPQFRGPESGNRVAEAGNLPLTWDVATGRGVLWRTNVPLAGYNSPVVWGDRVFLTGGDKKSRLVFCFDAATGSLRWQRPVTPTNALAAPIDPPDQSGAAASTVATDGRRVFAVFASGELGALDFEGTLVWHTRLDFSENGYGHAASLVVSGGRVLVQADQGQPEDGKSQLLALDAATGKVVWTAKRPVGGSWTTPLVVGAGEAARVITAGDPWFMAHELASGAEVWRARLLGGELAPSPVHAGGMVLAVWPGHAFYALKTDGTGDVTASHVAWKLEEEIPDVPTPVVAGDLLFAANTEGHLICRELATGGKVWDHAFETEFQATPLVVGDRMYLFSQPGKVFVVAVGREFKELASFEMGEEIYASPAVAGGRMYVRTKTALFGLGDGAGPTQVAQNAR